MNQIRRADPGARRQALLLVGLGAVLAALLIAGFEHYRPRLHQWLMSEPRELGRRLRLILLTLAAVMSVPLLAVATYVWSLGGRVQRAGEFPLPGQRVIRDTPVVTGQRAVLRGRLLKVLAIGLAVLSALSWVVLWSLAGLVDEQTP